jgi:hypothetical protein
MRRIVPIAVLFLLACSSSHSPDEDAGRPLDDGGCASCAPPPMGCHYEGGGDCECGTLVCDGLDACVPPPCAAPPIGCEYVGAGPCDCGTLVCDGPDACVPPPCAAPPEGCRYEGGGLCECGTLVCDCPSAAVQPSVICFDGGEVPMAHITVYDPGACFCGETIACDATQDSNGTIHLEVRAEGCELCDACFPQLRGSCTLEGVRLTPSPVYDVTINGVPALSGLSWGATQCWDPAGPIEGSLICSWPGTALDATTVTDVCVPSEANSFQPVVVRATACLDDCFDVEAGCVINETATGYEVQPLLRQCDCPVCGACAPGCHDRTFYCTLPQLEDGSYSITVAGSTSSITVSNAGTGNASCDDRI